MKNGQRVGPQVKNSFVTSYEFDQETLETDFDERRRDDSFKIVQYQYVPDANIDNLYF